LDWHCRLGGWATGRQLVTVNKLTVRKPNCGLETLRLSGIDLDNGKRYEKRDEDSKLECGIVYKQILINAKLQIERSGQKQNDWGSLLRRRRFALDCRAI